MLSEVEARRKMHTREFEDTVKTRNWSSTNPSPLQAQAPISYAKTKMFPLGPRLDRKGEIVSRKFD